MAARSPGFRLSAQARRTTAPPINFLMRAALEREGLISLAAGFVDDETLPVAEMAEIAAGVLSDEAAGRKALQYGTTIGLGELREALLAHVEALDGVSASEMSVTPEHVVVASGSQQLLYLLGEVLIDPGDIVITPWPSYFVYTGALTSLGAEVRAVDMDADGMVPEALAAALEGLAGEGDLGRVKLLYLCDYYQNPTGITLSAARRGRLLEIVRSAGAGPICVLEDAAYRELYYDAPPPPSIKSHEPDNAQVVLAQTFSKPFSPGLRTGYAILPDELVGPVLNQKANHDFGSANFCQHVLARALAGGAYARHVEVLRRRYREKRDAMLAALEEHLGDFEGAETRWTRPGGGLYVYLTLPKRMDTGPDGPLFAAAMRAGVMYVPGRYCYGPDRRRRPERNHMRLSFGAVRPDAIVEGVARLARAIKTVAAGRR